MHIFSSIKSWLAEPFNTQMDAFQWVMFLGLVIVAAALWNFVLLEIARDV